MEIRSSKTEGLADAGESYRAAGGTKNTTGDGGVKKQSRLSTEEYFTKDKYFDRQIDAWKEKADGTRIKVGELNKGSALNQIGFPAESMWFDVGKIKKEPGNGSKSAATLCR